MNKLILPILFLAVLAMNFFTGCKEEYSPKPRGYFRIGFPEKKYVKFDTTFPYTFEYPVYARVVPDTRPTSEPYWANIDFPQFKGKIHISYKPVEHNLETYLEDSRTFVVSISRKLTLLTTL